jgi:hypothetical protein
MLTTAQVKKLAEGSPFPRQVIPAPRPSQPVAQINEEDNLSGHKWVILSTGPAPQRKAELEAELDEQRKSWVIRNGRFERIPSDAEVEREVRKFVNKLSPAEREALKKRIAEEREAERLRKAEPDPERRFEGFAKTDTGSADVTRLRGNEESRPLSSYGIDVDFGDGRRPLGGDAVEKTEKRPSFDNIFRQRTWNGVTYHD